MEPENIPASASASAAEREMEPTRKAKPREACWYTSETIDRDIRGVKEYKTKRDESLEEALMISISGMISAEADQDYEVKNNHNQEVVDICDSPPKVDSVLRSRKGVIPTI